MARRLAKRIGRLCPSATMEVRRQAEELRRQGVEVIDLGPGEPDFDTPGVVKSAGIRAIEAGSSKYTQAAGIPELREAISLRYREDYGTVFGADEVLVSAGAKQGLFSLALVLIEEGDEVLIPSPHWVTYPEIVRLCGGKPVFVPTRAEDGFHIDLRTLASHVTSNTKALIVNSPCNPTGAVLSFRELEELVSLGRENGLYIIFDESYERIVYCAEPVSAAPLRGEHVIIVNSLSKSHAMAGWRIGWVLGPERVIRAATTVQSHSITHPASMAQRAALAALAQGKDATSDSLQKYRRRRDLCLAALRQMPGVACHEPEGAFYLFPHVDFPGESVALAAYLLAQAHVAVVPGVAFGCEGHIRVSFSVSCDRLEEALARMGRALERAGEAAVDR